MSNKFPLVIALVTIIIFIGGIFLFSKNQTTPASLPLPENYQYFWGNGCPHCANVEKFLESWNMRDKVKIDKYEVWGNRDNANLMSSRASYCKLNLTNLAVPMLFTPDGKCIEGDEPIIDFLKNLNLP